MSGVHAALEAPHVAALCTLRCRVLVAGEHEAEHVVHSVHRLGTHGCGVAHVSSCVSAGHAVPPHAIGCVTVRERVRLQVVGEHAVHIDHSVVTHGCG